MKYLEDTLDIYLHCFYSRWIARFQYPLNVISRNILGIYNKSWKGVKFQSRDFVSDISGVNYEFLRKVLKTQKNSKND